MVWLLGWPQRLQLQPERLPRNAHRYLQGGVQQEPLTQQQHAPFAGSVARQMQHTPEQPGFPQQLRKPAVQQMQHTLEQPGWPQQLHKPAGSTESSADTFVVQLW